MSLYVIALIVVGGAAIVTLVTYFLFFRVGKSQGAATAKLDTAQANLEAVKKADAIVTKEVTRADLQKSLRDGSF